MTAITQQSAPPIISGRLYNITNAGAVINLQDKRLQPGIYFVKVNYRTNNQLQQESLKVIMMH